MFNLILAFIAVFSASYGIPLETQSSNNRIHGGVDAPKGFAPHMAALLWRTFVVCGGSIVTRQHVLTAAHCITIYLDEDMELPPFYHGRVGSNIWHSGGVAVTFKAHYVHPKWDEENIKYDVGILVLAFCLVFNHKVAPIGLDFEWVGGGVKSYVTGWGRTWPRIEDNAINLSPTPDDLQLIFLTTLTPEQCKEGMQASEEWKELAPFLKPEVEICTFHSVGYGVCHGDSGSALVTVHSGLQSGIVSWGMPCAVGAPDVYTRLKGVKKFVLTIIKKVVC